MVGVSFVKESSQFVGNSYRIMQNGDGGKLGELSFGEENIGKFKLLIFS